MQRRRRRRNAAVGRVRRLDVRGSASRARRSPVGWVNEHASIVKRASVHGLLLIDEWPGELSVHRTGVTINHEKFVDLGLFGTERRGGSMAEVEGA